jgi:hypothetical protein
VLPLGSLKINIDVAYFAISRKSALDFIICDHEGNHVLTVWRLLFNSKDAETLACLDDIRLASRWSHCVQEFDCPVLVTKLNSSVHCY